MLAILGLRNCRMAYPLQMDVEPFLPEVFMIPLWLNAIV